MVPIELRISISSRFNRLQIRNSKIDRQLFFFSTSLQSEREKNANWSFHNVESGARHWPPSDLLYDDGLDGAGQYLRSNPC